MDFTKETIDCIMELVEQAESYRPIVKDILNAIKSYSPEISELPEKYLQWVREENIKSVNYYMENGLKYDDAVDMTIAEINKMKKALGDSLSYKKKEN